MPIWTEYTIMFPLCMRFEMKACMLDAACYSILLYFNKAWNKSYLNNFTKLPAPQTDKAHGIQTMEEALRSINPIYAKKDENNNWKNFYGCIKENF